MTEQELKEMKLHETMTEGNLQVTRVIGGWIYTIGRGIGTVKETIALVFVPEQITVNNTY